MYKILLMDDDHNYLASLEELLSINDYQVIVSSPMEDTISFVNKIQPDLIVLDYLMGDVFGGNVCIELKENETTKHIPVIILTAYDKVFNALGTYGCNASISKTADSEVLFGEIKRLLK